MSRHEESGDNLWLLTLAPAIWAFHFLLSYTSAAVWCAKVVDRGGSLDGVRSMIAVYTAAALTGILLAGWRGYRMHRLGDGTVPHDLDTPEDRHRFLGFATLLLSGLSGVATIFVGIVALFFRTCR